MQFANIPRIEISSTHIRERWVEDKTIRYMVTQPVWEFINEYNLYASENIKKVNIISRILKSINYLIWGDV